MVSQVVIVIVMVVSAVLETSLSSGVLPSSTVATPGAATCSTTRAVCTGSTAISQLVPPFVASGIDYLTI